MLHRFKKHFYFIVASYFAFWAGFVLSRWRPRIIVITGSSGKTTLLHLIEAQLGDQAIYSHHANSAIGIPFHILGLKPNVSSKSRWLIYIVAAPFHSLRRLPKQNLYVVEADCDRPHEGRFIANFLRPEVSIWISVYRTHSMNFDKLVQGGEFRTHEEAIAHEFGYFTEATTKLVLANGDQALLVKELSRVASDVVIKQASISNVSDFRINKNQTVFEINKVTVQVPGLHPKELGVGLQLVNDLLSYLDMPFDPTYQRLEMPPGRSSVLRGKHDTIMIDSTYNTGLGATVALLQLFEHYPNRHKWLVIGDILEQGSLEKDEHQKLAHEITKLNPETVVLLGKRTKSHTFPLLKENLRNVPVVTFSNPKDVLDYLQRHIKGGEVLLFKGAQGLEGVIEQLLDEPSDSSHLVRREKAWIKRRQAWGLPK